MGQTCPQLAQHIGKKLAVPAGAVHALEHSLIHTGQQLLDDHIDTGHILMRHGAVEVPCTIAQTSRGIVVLDGMADVLAVVGMAPGRQNTIKVVAVQLADQIHIGILCHMSALIAAVQEQQRQQRTDVPGSTVCQSRSGQLSGQQVLHAIPPGQVHGAVVADGGILRPVDVAKPRLIREEPAQRFAKILPEVGIDRLIDGIQQYLGRRRIQRVQIAFRLFLAALVADSDDVQSPLSIRQVKIHGHAGTFLGVAGQRLAHGGKHDLPRTGIFKSINFVRQVDGCGRVNGFKRGFAAQGHSQDFVTRVAEGILENSGHVLHRAGIIQRFAAEKLFAQLRVLPLDRTIRKTGGKVAVIQDPHLHTRALCFVQQQGQIPEPARTVEILVRTGFHTEAADAAFADFLHLAAQFFFTLYAMHPQKGIQGIGGLSMQDITNAFHARVLSFRFTHSEHSTAPVPFARGRCHAGNITLFRPRWSQHNCRLQKPQRQWLHRSGSPRS